MRMDPLAPRLTVVEVFNSCLEVFKFIQKGRKFGEEYEERLAKFEAAKHRLLSWGDRVDITHDTLLQANFEHDIEPVFSALRQLEQLFRKVQKCLEKYEIQVRASEELALASAHADRQSSQPLLSMGIFEEWSKSRKDQAQQRVKQAKMIQKALFVLDAETLDNLFVRIEYFLEFLDSEERHRHRSAIRDDHASYDGQWRYPNYGGQIYLLPEDLSADDKRISAPAGAVSQLALRPGSIISTQSAPSGPLKHPGLPAGTVSQLALRSGSISMQSAPSGLSKHPGLPAGTVSQLALRSGSISTQSASSGPLKHPGFVAKLFVTTRAAFASLAALFSQTNVDDRHKRCQNELERFFLWGQGLSVVDGHLDGILAHSKELHFRVLSLLLRLGTVILDSLSREESSQSMVSSEQCDDLRTLLETTEAKLQESEPDLIRADTLSVSDTSEYGLEDILEEVTTYVDCLLDLAPSLDNPALNMPGDYLDQFSTKKEHPTWAPSLASISRVSNANDASWPSSFSEPSRTLSEPPPTPFEDTCKVWRETDFDERQEQTEHSTMNRQFSNSERSTQQCTTAEIVSANTSISAFTPSPSLARAGRHITFPMLNQQEHPTWVPSLASISSGTVEGFSTCSLNLNLDGRRCLASALDRNQLAILTRFDTVFEVYLFDTNQSPVPGHELEALGHHTLESGKWTGIAIAGSYLAAWGEKVLHLAVRNDSPDAVEYDVCFAGSSPTFNTSQKAALSRNGVLATTNGQEIELRFASNRPDTPVHLRCPVKVTKSIDIAFNEEGDNLYYWARVLNAFLFSWQLKDVGNNPDPVSATQYSCKQGEKIDEATLFPYNRQRGCIVGYSACTVCFPGLVSGKQPIGKPVKRNFSEELKRKQVQAARVLDDSSLIAIQGPSSRFTSELAVYEYPLVGQGISASIGNGKKLGKL